MLWAQSSMDREEIEDIKRAGGVYSSLNLKPPDRSSSVGVPIGASAARLLAEAGMRKLPMQDDIPPAGSVELSVDGLDFAIFPSSTMDSVNNATDLEARKQADIRAVIAASNYIRRSRSGSSAGGISRGAWHSFSDDGLDKAINFMTYALDDAPSTDGLSPPNSSRALAMGEKTFFSESGVSLNAAKPGYSKTPKESPPSSSSSVLKASTNSDTGPPGRSISPSLTFTRGSSAHLAMSIDQLDSFTKVNSTEWMDPRWPSSDSHIFSPMVSEKCI